MRPISLLFSIVFIAVLVSNKAISQHPQDTLTARKHYVVGDSLQTITDYTASIKSFDKALMLYQKAQAWKKVVDCYYKLSQNYQWLAEYQKSIEMAKKSASICAEKLGENRLEEARAYWLVSNTNIAIEQHGPTMEYCEKAAQILRKTSLESSSLMGNIYSEMSKVYHRKRDYIKAMDAAEKSVAILSRTLGPDHSDTHSAKNVLAMILDERGYNAKAIEIYESIIRGQKNPVGRAKIKVSICYYNMANVYAEIGEVEKALEYHNHAMSMVTPIVGFKHPMIATYYNGLGTANGRLEKYKEALEYFRKSLSIKISLFGPRNIRVSNSYSNMGNCYFHVDSVGRALEVYNLALDIRRENLGEKNPAVAASLRDIAHYYEFVKNYDTAKNYFLKSVQMFEELLGRRNPEVATSYYDLGNFTVKTRKWDQALEYFQKGLIANSLSFDNMDLTQNPSYDENFVDMISLSCLRGKAYGFFEKYQQNKMVEDLKMAIHHFNFCDSLIQKLWRSHKRVDDKSHLAHETTKIYEGAIRACLAAYGVKREQKYLEQAFSFSEKSKAGVLTEVLSDLSAKSFGLVPERLVAFENQLKVDKAFYHSAIMAQKSGKSGYDTVMVKGYESKLFRVNRSLDSLVENFERNFPSYFALKYKARLTDAVSLQEQINPDQAVIEYFEGDSSLFVFTISKEAFLFKEIRKDSLLDKTIEDLINSLKYRNKYEYVVNAHKVYNSLLAPVVSQLNGVDKLIIIPDGKLSYFPFESLIITKPDPAMGFKSFDYVLNKYEITYHYSTDLLDNPNADNKARNLFLGIAPHAFKSAQVPLEASAEEVTGIATLLGGDVFVGKTATEESFKKIVAEYDIVHLASHAEIDDKNALHSKLYFSSEGDTVDDAILYTHELYNLKLNADLVTLSACNTGTGKFYKGEGIMSIARGFMYAGVPNVVMSLWKVSDEPTKDMMIFFYEEIRKGASYAAAMRNAKLRYINQSDNVTADPYYWSAFVFVGNPDLETSYASWAWVIGAATILGLVAILVQRRKIGKKETVSESLVEER